MSDRRTDEDIERDWQNAKAITGMNDKPEVLTDDELIAALRERLADIRRTITAMRSNYSAEEVYDAVLTMIDAALAKDEAR